MRDQNCYLELFRRIILCGLMGLFAGIIGGCTTTTTMHVWQTPRIEMPLGASIALGPVSGEPFLAESIEQAILKQRPAVCADLALFTPQQLSTVSPFRLASTASLNHEATALVAARAAGADILAMGAIARSDIKPADLQETQEAKVENPNGLGLQRLLSGGRRDEEHHHILLTWRFLEVSTGRHLGAQSFNINTRQASKEYPDLEADSNPATRLVSAAARETWKGLAPVVAPTNVRLANPWLQPGSFWVRRGNRAAKKGDWQLAEKRWRGASRWFWFNAPARHNLALVHAARGEFAEAKKMVGKARGPLAVRLPSETLFWLDQHHRLYHAAHGLDEPAEGWAIPRADELQITMTEARPIDIEQLPWWTAIPLLKPTELTWQEYWALW